jgi:hypothetical protein
MLIGRVRDWYGVDLTFSLQFINTFVVLVEDQAQTAIDKYRAEKKTETVPDISSDDGSEYSRNIETYGGFDDDLFDLKYLWEVYFPSLLRRSALITVYGFFEHELQQLCERYRNEKKFRLAISDLRDEGDIKTQVTYLEKVANLHVHKSTQTWVTINHIRVVRNTVVHSDGRILGSDGKVPEKLSNAMEFLKIGTNSNELLFEKGFLAQVVDVFTAYFRMIDESIQEAEGPRS